MLEEVFTFDKLVRNIENIWELVCTDCPGKKYFSEKLVNIDFTTSMLSD